MRDDEGVESRDGGGRNERVEKDGRESERRTERRNNWRGSKSGLGGRIYLYVVKST